MVWENTDIWGDSSGTLDGGYGSTTGVDNTNVSWTDRIFSTGTDFVSQFLDYQAKTRLAEEQYKYQLAANNQQSILGTAEVPQNVQAAPIGITYPVQQQQTIAGLDRNMVLIGVLGLVAYLAIK
jgi:hypothetical protein